VGPGVDEARAVQDVGDDTKAVSAGLGQGAVGVAVVHEEGPVTAADDAQHAVGADTSAAVAPGDDGRGCEVESVIGVEQDDEIVAGAVGFQIRHRFGRSAGGGDVSHRGAAYGVAVSA